MRTAGGNGGDQTEGLAGGKKEREEEKEERLDATEKAHTQTEREREKSI